MRTPNDPASEFPLDGLESYYQEFRQTRTRTKDAMKLADTLDNFSTSKEYKNHVKQILIKYKGKIWLKY